MVKVIYNKRKMELVKVNAEDFGIEETKAQEISKQFKPMLDKMEDLEKSYNKIVKMKHSPEKEAKAKRLRLDLQSVRTGTASIHKAQKAFYLAGGRFVDAWKNAQLFASQGLEEKLKEIETKTEREEALKREELQLERKILISDYIDENSLNSLNFGAMDQEVWEAYFTQKKKDFEAIQEAERQAKEKAELEEKRQSLLNPYLPFEGQQTFENLSNFSEKLFNKLLNDAKREKERAEELKRIEKERSLELRQFGNLVNWELDFSTMSKSDYEAYFADLQKQSKEIEEKAKQAEKAQENINQRIKELQPFTRFIKDLNKIVNLRKDEYSTKLKEIKAYAKKQEEKEAIEAKETARVKAENERIKARIAKDKEAREKAEKLESERLAKIEHEKAELAKKGDKAIFDDWINSFELPEISSGLGENKQNLKKWREIQQAFETFKKWSLAKIE